MSSIFPIFLQLLQFNIFSALFKLTKCYNCLTIPTRMCFCVFACERQSAETCVNELHHHHHHSSDVKQMKQALMKMMEGWLLSLIVIWRYTLISQSLYQSAHEQQDKNSSFTHQWTQTGLFCLIIRVYQCLCVAMSLCVREWRRLRVTGALLNGNFNKDAINHSKVTIKTHKRVRFK